MGESFEDSLSLIGIRQMLDIKEIPDAEAPVSGMHAREGGTLEKYGEENKEYTILIVDDNRDMRDLLSTLLGKSYNIETAPDGIEGLKMTRAIRPDLIIADVMMPVLDGKEMTRILKEDSDFKSIPVIMLTARGEEMDRIIGLEVGADDYMPKPFNPRELLARIRAVLRRSVDTRQKQEEKAILKAGGVTLNLHCHCLSRGSQDIELSATEYRMMELFMKYPDRVFSRDEIMNHARGRDFIAFERSIDVHISRLRAKLETLEGCGVSIKTVWGAGYALRILS